VNVKSPKTYHHYLLALLLVVAIVAVFWQVFGHAFVRWDDDLNVYENRYLHPVTPHNTLRFWRTPFENLYIPLTYTVWAFVAIFARQRPEAGTGYDLNPHVFHAANLVLHLLSVLVVYNILRILLRTNADSWKKDLAAAFGALLFAAHPLQVEPVAWVTGMKDVLSGLLSLIAIWQYVSYARRMIDGKTGAARRSYVFALFAFILALLAKPSSVAVPLVAWVLDCWLLRRSVRQSTLALAGWAVLVVPFIAVTRFAQPTEIGIVNTPLWFRPLIAGDALAFYLSKLVAPFRLAMDYGRSPNYVLRHWWIYITWLVPVVLAFIVWRMRGRQPWAASVGVFVVGVLPVLGLTPFEMQNISTVADRYLYVSMLGPALALAWFIRNRSEISIEIGCALILCALGVTSSFQLRHWRDTMTLFDYTLKINPNSAMAHNNLGAALAKQGKFDEAIKEYMAAIRSRPNHAEAYNNLGNALASQGKIEKAIYYYRKALQIKPYLLEAHFNIGVRLAERGKIEEAIAHHRKALTVDPEYPNAHYGLGLALAIQGKTEEAIAQYEEAIRFKSNYAEAHAGLGLALAELDRTEEAIGELRKAIWLNPKDAVSRYNLSNALARQGKIEEAIKECREAIRIEPDMAQAHNNLAVLSYFKGNYAEAWREISIAQRLGYLPDPALLDAIHQKMAQH